MRTFFLLLILGFILDSRIALSAGKTVGKASFVATTNAGFDVKGEGAAVLGTEIVTGKPQNEQ